MWHCVWWCDTVYDDVTLCMMMWHCVWWCDTVYDDVTLCMMTWRLKVHEWSKYVLQNYTYSISTRALPFANLSTCMYPPPHMTYMYLPPHTICVKRTCLLVCILLLIWHTCILLLIPYLSSELVYLYVSSSSYDIHVSSSSYHMCQANLSTCWRSYSHMGRSHAKDFHILYSKLSHSLYRTIKGASICGGAMRVGLMFWFACPPPL